MTDLEKLEKIFTEIGVKFEKKPSIKEWGTETHTLSYDGEATYDNKITLENGNSAKQLLTVAYYGKSNNIFKSISKRTY
jgi:hypothetical protein